MAAGAVPVAFELVADELFFLGACEHAAGGVDGERDLVFFVWGEAGDELDECFLDAEFAEDEQAVFAVEEAAGADEDGDALAVFGD